MRTVLIGLTIALAGCGGQSDQGDGKDKETAAIPKTPLGHFEDVEAATAAAPQDLPILQAQVMLDRAGFSPGLLDGKQGQSFNAALRGFQEARDLPQTGKLDESTRKILYQNGSLPPTRTIRLPENFVSGPFTPNLPSKLSDQADMPYLGYRNSLEKLAERFHTTPEVLAKLNTPNMTVRAGAILRVPNVPDPDEPISEDDVKWRSTLATLGVSARQPAADHIEVDKSEGVLRVLDDAGTLIAQFPATMGSEHDPLPLGNWTIKGVSHNPEFHYNPDLFWDASSSDSKGVLGPGPNGPVGVVWIDLSKPHYGIHGTPEPALIGRTESHGCIRLTNWDAARLAQMVKSGTKAKFTS